MKKTYGAGWQSVFYALANKRSGKGVRGAHRMHGVASSAYRKGAHWRGRSTSSRTRSSTSGRSHSVSIRTRGSVNHTHRSHGTHVHIRVH